MATTERCVGRGTLFTDRRCFVRTYKATLFFLSDRAAHNALSHRSDPPGVDGAARADRGAPVRALHPRARLADEPASAGGLTFAMAGARPKYTQEAAVEMVILPGGDGMFGVMPSHVPTISELKPGTISVQETAGGELTKYFISGGFASGAQTVAPPVSPPS